MTSAFVSARSLAFALGLLLAGSATTACKSNSDKASMDGDHDAAGDESEAIGTPSGATCPTDNKPTYDTFGKAFMDDYCVRCHSSKLKGNARNGAPDGHDFDLLPGILPVAEHIDEYAAAGPDSVNKKMPPDGDKPSMEEREMLGQWLACELDALDK